MNLRERVENNLALWTLSIAVAGFLAGLATYKNILDIAQLEVIPRSRLEELREASGQTEDASKQNDSNQAREAGASQTEPPIDDGSGLSTQAEVISRSRPEKLRGNSRQIEDANKQNDSTQIREAGALQAKPPVAGRSGSSTQPENSTPLEVKFSAQFPPFPEQLDTIRPGMRLSEAKAALPNGSLYSGFYSVDILSGPFVDVTYYPKFGSDGENDPVIRFIVFTFRDGAVKQAVTAATLREYGNLTHKTEMLGSIIKWPNVGGYELAIEDDIYKISSLPESK